MDWTVILFRFLPVGVVIWYTIGYGRYLKQQGQKGFMGTVVLSSLLAGVLVYLTFFRDQ